MKYNVSTFSCRRLTTSAVLTGEITATVGVSGAASSLTSTAEINIVMMIFMIMMIIIKKMIMIKSTKQTTGT